MHRLSSYTSGGSTLRGNRFSWKMADKPMCMFALHLAPTVSALTLLHFGILSLQLSVCVPDLTPSAVTSRPTISSKPSDPLITFLMHLRFASWPFCAFINDIYVLTYLQTCTRASYQLITDLGCINQLLYNTGSHGSLLMITSYSARPIFAFYGWQHLDTCTRLVLDSTLGLFSTSNNCTKHLRCHGDLSTDNNKAIIDSRLLPSVAFWWTEANTVVWRPTGTTIRQTSKQCRASFWPIGPMVGKHDAIHKTRSK